eukprot:TRINITY_DN5812_c0_g1_i1.p1 TRINITY_DN5812_c0_g1~~TRINITY_DN5812_c0_g1_i1.p1  ORF type:complete len:211 (+),score=90.94 TRINITY_DN5812_c0_g1_i1:217-849(+)
MKKKWKSITVKDVSGKTPTIYWVTKEGDDVGAEEEISADETEADLIARFEAKGLTADSPKLKVTIKPTKACKAFRQTTLAGKRIKKGDKHCEDEVAKNAGVGYCDCRDGVKVYIENDRNRVPFTCEAVCVDPDHTLPWGTFKPQPTENCIAFRSAEKGKDKQCDETVTSAMEGKCECKTGEPIRLVKNTAEKVTKFTCEERCAERSKDEL